MLFTYLSSISIPTVPSYELEHRVCYKASPTCRCLAADDLDYANHGHHIAGKAALHQIFRKLNIDGSRYSSLILLLILG